MAVASGDVLKVAVKWRHSIAGDQVNTWHLGVSDVLAGTNADALAAVTLWAEHMYQSSGVTNYMTALLRHEDIAVFNHNSGGFPVGNIGRLPDLDGAGSTQSLPSITAPLLVLRTNVSRMVGRKYLPTFTEEAMLDGKLNEPAYTVIQVMANDLIVPYEAIGYMTLSTLVRAADGLSVATVSSYAIREHFARIGTRQVGKGS